MLNCFRDGYRYALIYLLSASKEIKRQEGFSIEQQKPK